MESIFWIALCIFLIIMELATMGLTSIWFAAGAFAAFIANGLHCSLFVQLLVFVAVSGALLYFTRPFVVKYLNSRTVKTNIDSLIGKTALVTEDIENLQSKGQVSINRQIWSARSFDEEISFVKGNHVDIVEIRGNKLIVCKHTDTDG